MQNALPFSDSPNNAIKTLASFIVVDLEGELWIPLLTLKTFQANLHLGEMKNVTSPCESCAYAITCDSALKTLVFAHLYA